MKKPKDIFLLDMDNYPKTIIASEEQIYKARNYCPAVAEGEKSE